MPNDKPYEPRLIEKVEGDGAFYELYQTEDVPNVFVDGISDLISGPAVCQLKLHRIDSVDFDQQKDGLLLEKRVLKVNLIMPTVQLIEIATKILDHFVSNKDTVVKQIRDRAEYANLLLSPKGAGNDQH